MHDLDTDSVLSQTSSPSSITHTTHLTAHPWHTRGRNCEGCCTMYVIVIARGNPP